MSVDVGLVVVAGTFMMGAFLTGLVRRLAIRHGIVDVPNERSSHEEPTPRGGGISIVVASFLGWLAMRETGELTAGLAIALLGGGLAVAIVGYLDDRTKLSVWVRLLVHFCAAVWALVWLGGVPDVRLGDRFVSFGPMGNVLATVAIVWTLNLFNFMDGIDGIAASEAIFVACAGAVLGARAF